jgi:hypothetical protein
MLKLIAGCTGIIISLLATAVLAGGPQQQLAECRADNKKAYNEVEMLCRQARTSGNMGSDRNAFTAAEYKLQDHGRWNMSERLTLPACQELKRQIAQDRADIQRMMQPRRR